MLYAPVHVMIFGVQVHTIMAVVIKAPMSTCSFRSQHCQLSLVYPPVVQEHAVTMARALTIVHFWLQWVDGGLPGTNRVSQ